MVVGHRLSVLRDDPVSQNREPKTENRKPSALVPRPYFISHRAAEMMIVRTTETTMHVTIGT